MWSPSTVSINVRPPYRIQVTLITATQPRAGCLLIKIIIPSQKFLISLGSHWQISQNNLAFLKKKRCTCTY